MRRGAAGWARTEADGAEDLGETDELDDDEDLAEDDEPGVKSSGFASQFAIAQAAPAKALAVAIGRALDLRQVKFKPVAKTDVDALIAALPGELYLKKVRDLFSYEDYFKRALAAVAIAAIEEMGGNPLKSAKKSVLAEAAAAEARAKNWLPAELRHPDYRLTSKTYDGSGVTKEERAAGKAKRGRK
jgi:hypothetical protein